jgi:non-canonical (house-cleaning) NTP pyrophosphatase
MTERKGATVLRVAVGSSNPSKLKAVQQALERIVSRKDDKIVLDLHPCSVPSGVPDQPFGDEETKLGAKNRARAAQSHYKEIHGEMPHFAIGLEGGLEWLNDELLCMAWMAVVGSRSPLVLGCTASTDCGAEYDVSKDDSSGCWGTAKTGTFALPSLVATLVKQGMELGDADDKVFSRVKAKHGSGTVGLLTDGLIDRSYYYEHALLLAMVPWIRPDVYPDGVE